jgi:tetrahydromethanopterin S-methyltransferase subunit B
VSAARRITSGFHSIAFHGVVNGLIVLTVGLLIITIAWHLTARRANPAG